MDTDHITYIESDVTVEDKYLYDDCHGTYKYLVELKPLTSSTDLASMYTPCIASV